MDDAVQQVELQVALLLRLADRNRRRSPRLGHTVERSAYLALDRLDTEGPLGINEIADHLRLDASTVTRQVLGMESQGFVARGRDEADGRRAMISLTPAGAAALAEARAARLAVYGEILASWSDDERRSLAAALAHLNQSMDEGLSSS